MVWRFAAHQRELLGQAGTAGRKLARRLERKRVVAVRSVGVGDVQPHLRHVAGRHEARQAGGDDHRVANDHVLTGMPDGFAGPGDSHDADRAVELRHVETDDRLAVRVELHRSGKERHQLLGRRTALGSHRNTVAAGAQPSGHAQRAVDQQPVEVAQLQPEPALAEEPCSGSGASYLVRLRDADRRPLRP